MGWNKLVELIDVKDPVPIAIAGYPGMGNIGIQVVSYLADKLDAKLTAKIYSEYLMLSSNVAGIIINKDGTFKLPAIEIRLADKGQNRLFLVSSPVQPVPWGQLEVSSLLFDYLKEKGVKVIFIIAGFVDRTLYNTVITFGDEEWTKKLEELGSIRNETIRSVIGLAGANLTLARLRGFRYVFVSGVAADYLPDPKPAQNILDKLNSIMSLGIDMEEMGRRVQEFESRLRPKEKSEISQDETKNESMNYLG
ncbi:MAG: hypothetical protein DRN90_07595 [Thermoproteota archaeon]|nr:MAG: hypothetical protein DRN90_07595 [Candidatus Korarchaeota archaeon]